MSLQFSSSAIQSQFAGLHKLLRSNIQQSFGPLGASHKSPSMQMPQASLPLLPSTASLYQPTPAEHLGHRLNTWA